MDNISQRTSYSVGWHSFRSCAHVDSPILCNEKQNEVEYKCSLILQVLCTVLVVIVFRPCMRLNLLCKSQTSNPFVKFIKTCLKNTTKHSSNRISSLTVLCAASCNNSIYFGKKKKRQMRICKWLIIEI